MTDRHFLAALTAIAIAASSAVAGAQPSHDPVAAQALFDAAKRLVAQGKYGEACSKLEESQRLDPAIGTHYALAECYEKAGRLASAWVAFLDVASESSAQGRADREKYAKARAAALMPRLSRITVNVPAAARVAGLQIKKDSETLREAQWGVAVPADTGSHVIAASAPGKVPFETTVVTREDGTTLGVDIPPLADAPSAPTATTSFSSTTTAPTTISTEEHHGTSAQPVIGIVVGAAGVAGLAVGAIFGAEALSKHSASQQQCQGNACTPAGIQDVNDGKSAGNISTIALAAGAAALVGGAVLWLTAPRGETKTGLRAAPIVARDGGGFAIQGAW
jgi:serine/threonine-protein kinase